MGRIRQTLFALAAAAMIASTARADTKAPSAAPTAPAKRTPAELDRLASDAVKSAVTRLAKELDDAAKDPKVGLRAKSDFFQQNKSPDATPIAIANALNRSLGRDVPSDTYIKWQLCSGLKGVTLDAKQDPKLVNQLLSAYRSAPAPSVRPGLDPSEKRELDRRSKTIKVAELPELNKLFEALVARWDKSNEPVIAYRDELYALLSPLPESLQVSFGDGYLRASRGVDCGKLMKSVMAQVQAWAASAPPQQVMALAQDIKRMAQEMNALSAKADAGGTPRTAYNRPNAAPGGPAGKASFPPKFYTKCEQDEKTHLAVWREGQADFVKPDDMAAMYTALLDIIKSSDGNNGGGLKFKDTPKP
jgi:hypothetical protein